VPRPTVPRWTVPRWTVPRAASIARLPPWLLPLGLAALLVAVPWLNVDPTWTRQLILISILALIVSGLNLSWGYAGELSLGQVAMYAAGAYVGGILTTHNVDLALALPAAAASAAMIGLISGVAGIRLAGWGLAMVSFFLVLLVPDTVQIFASQTGGFAGLSGIPTPRLFGADLSQQGYYVLVAGCLIVWLTFLRNLVTSRHGGALRVMRQSGLLASSLGINVTRMKLTAYLLGAVPAGAAGCLFALLDSFVSPNYFGLDLAIAIIAASVLGGSESVYGAVLGAALLQLGPMRTTAFHQYALVAYGAFLVVGGVLLSGGVSGLASRLLRGVMPAAAPVAGDVRRAGEIADIDPIPGQTLQVQGVTKQFGGARALGGLDLVASQGAVTGLIGANGSGKTTLLNIISGFYVPTAGSVLIGGRPVAGQPAHRLARRGVARTFQTPVIPRSMTAAEVVAAARYMRHRSGIIAAVLRLPSFRRARRSDREAALRALRVLGIERLADQPASALPLGSRRLVEVARALAAEPALLLLDEPASGLDTDEVAGLGRVIRRLGDAGATVLLVEHNFQLICDVSDQVYVLEAGRLIASGTPDQIRRDKSVIRSYLGQLAESMLDEELAGMDSGSTSAAGERGAAGAQP
jgi:branched-chain amino acid transport system permease protein